MHEEIAEKTFAKYNPKSDVVRCPNGRAPVRKVLDSYAEAAVNLYGAIHCDDFMGIFNGQNTEKTTVEEIYLLLLPLVLKNRRYAFYKGRLVHHVFFNHFDWAENLLKHQEGKPRYIPDQAEFLKYVCEDYHDKDHWQNVRRFLWDLFGINKETNECYHEVREYITNSRSMANVGSILAEYNLRFSGENELQRFLDLVTAAENNTRMWENNGYTPSELHEILRKRRENVVELPRKQVAKIGRNEPCPCGSGKKYKKCCAVFDDIKSAQLSIVECRLFYETWYGLMGYVNARKNVIKTQVKPEHPNPLSDALIYKTREVLWENPELIDEYIGNTRLSQEEAYTLWQWRTKHIKGMVYVIKYMPEYAVVLATDKEGGERLYGIKGLSNSLANILRRRLPTPVELVMLPFRGKIIYDSIMEPMSVELGQGIVTFLQSAYNEAAKQGIITSLD